MPVSMIQIDMIWHSDHRQQANRELMVLQQQLFNQKIERNKYYGKSSNNENDMEQERNEDWNDMVHLERYHVMSESEIIQRLNRENQNSLRYISTSDHVMMAWENLEEAINENKNDDNNNSFED